MHRGGKHVTTNQKSCPKQLTGTIQAQLTVLESNSCLFCAKTFSTPACSAYVTNPNPLRRNKNEKHLKNNSDGKAWNDIRHPVIGRRKAHASFLPRPLGNGIPHHHALLHLAKFTEVLLQALCKDSKENVVIHIQTSDVTFPTGPDEVMYWQWLEGDNGVGRTTLCLCRPCPPEMVHGLSGHSA